jgi:hypothetical protein
MNEEDQVEADLLTLAAEQFKDEGYTVVREPSANALPTALRALHPDAIAIGKHPNIVIEVVREGAQNTERVIRLKRATEEAGDWSLHLILDRGERKHGLDQVSVQTISRALATARRLVDVDTRAALLLGWASFEALVRAMEPSRFAKPQTPGRIVEALASDGVITPSEASKLRSLANTRNAVVHGSLRTQPSEADLEDFFRVLSRLQRAIARKRVTGT